MRSWLSWLLNVPEEKISEGTLVSKDVCGAPQLRKARRSLKSIFRVIFHSLGLSCIGASIILQLIVLIDIMRKGYFLGTEENPIILSAEIFLTVFGLTYFLILAIRIVEWA